MGEDHLVCLVTGATAGIGLATAEGLARAGAHVILGARTRERGEAARDRIARATGSDRLELAVAGLALQADVSRPAGGVAGRHDRLDGAVKKPGCIPSPHAEAPAANQCTLAAH